MPPAPRNDSVSLPVGTHRPPATHSPHRAALAVILVCQLMIVLDATIVNIALPDIRTALDFTPTGLSWVLNAYTLTFGGLLLLGARAGDLLGRRGVFLLGIAVFSAASLAGGFATSSTMLLIARAVQGLGGALAAPSALALLMMTTREGSERTRAVGLYTAVSIGGSAVGLVAGGMLVQWVSWEWVFFVNVPIGVALLIAARRVLPSTERKRGRIDWIGAITSTAGMTAIVFALVHAASDGWGERETVVAFAAGAVLLAVFVLTESRVSVPITPLRLFADRNRSSSYVARLLLVAGMMGMFFFLTQFLQGVLHYSPLATGLAFLPLTAFLFAASQGSARLIGRGVSPKLLMVGGLTLSALGLLYLTRLSADSGYLEVATTLVLFGAGNGLAFVPLTSLSLSGVDSADAGAASGLVNVAQQLGGSLGLAVLVSVFGAASASAARGIAPGTDAAARASEVFVAGADRAFWVAAALVVGSAVLVATTRSVHRPAPPMPHQRGLDDHEPVLAGEAH